MLCWLGGAHLIAGVISQECFAKGNSNMYKVSNKKLGKEKRSPIWTLVYVIVLGSILYLPDYSEDFDRSGLLFIITVAGALCVGARLYGVIRYLKWAKSHHVEVKHNGLSFQELGTTMTLPWEQVTSLRVKSKHGKVASIILTTKESGKIEFKDYDDLSTLGKELKSYIN
ncbi:hypothetical protein [Photobacterium kasasachensis]|uniref:hypothetical protein n=1 Tax=Photobacterium kasasachensis TaxID=2910240 RepID=UPI003D0A5BDD